MRVEVSNRQLIKIAAPISLALIIPQINYMTNTAFLGRLGEFPLAVNGIAGIYYLVMFMISYGFNNGMQILIARRTGEDNAQGIGRFFSQGIWLAAAFAAAGIILTYILGTYFFSHVLHSADISAAAISFIKIRIWGLPFLIMIGLANAFYIGTAQSKALIIISVLQEFTNIFFDYSLIFGHFGFAGIGLNGAAYASVIAEMVGFATSLSIILYNSFHQQYGLFKYLRLRLKVILHVLRISAPLIAQYLFSIGGWLVFFIFIEHLGEEPLAISNMLRSVFGFFGIFTWAFAATCNTMVSNIIGQGKEENVANIIRKNVIFSFGCAMIICLLLNIFPYRFLHIYTSNSQLIKDAIPSLIVISFSTLLMSVSAIIYNAVSGTGNTRVNLLIEMLAVGLYLIYCEVIIEHLRLPLAYAWGAEFVYWLVIIISGGLYLKSGRWKQKHI